MFSANGVQVRTFMRFKRKVVSRGSGLGHGRKRVGIHGVEVLFFNERRSTIIFVWCIDRGSHEQIAMVENKFRPKTWRASRPVLLCIPPLGYLGGGDLGSAIELNGSGPWWFEWRLN